MNLFKLQHLSRLRWKRLAIDRVRYVSTNSDVTAPLLQHLKLRGLVSNVSDEESLGKQLHDGIKKLTLYCGADPSANSLHVGNIIPLLVLLHFYIRGHNSIVLVGGATGEVGDPSGRTTERQQMQSEARENNIRSIHKQMIQFLEQGWKMAQKHGYAEQGTIVPANNADWWKTISMLGFLSTYGRHIRVSQMIARESVKARLNSEQGIGFNEFTYQILQAYDFWHLYKTKNCQIQVGGNDQWGNITAGIDLISRLSKKSGESVTKDHGQAYGLTVPLLTTPSGEKFGKSAGNAIWLDSNLTKPYDLYQYFIKSPDSVVEQYLKLFTLLPLSKIIEIMAAHNLDQSQRIAQKALAIEVTDLVHGEGSGSRSEIISSILFPSAGHNAGAGQPTASQILEAFESEGLVKAFTKSQILDQTWREVLSLVLGKSKSEAMRMVKAGGVYRGQERLAIADPAELVNGSYLMDGKLLLLRTGKANYTIVRVH